MANYKHNPLANLMAKICSRANLNQAYKRVRANKGKPGIDELTIEETKAYIYSHKEQIINSLINGSYKPKPVLKVEIPKPHGGVRTLGIPTVLDRIVQQAITQVLQPIFDPQFSNSSFGFRPGRGAHNALKQGEKYIKEGRNWVVDIDLEKFFDQVSHDKLMAKLAIKIKDKILLKLIRKYLQAGIMHNGVVTTRHQGTPQGSPLSPLLSNIVLDELDKELEKRGHKFCRYADDCNIHLHSQKAAERVYQSITKFIECKLKLKVNRDKSAVAKAKERKFLGYCLKDTGLSVSTISIKVAKEKIRKLTPRNSGKSFSQTIEKLNLFLRGWYNYYKLASSKSLWRELDSWIRRRLRCFRLKQRKRGSSISKMLRSLGVSDKSARQIGSSGKKWWRLSRTHAVHRALNNAWFENQGLYSLYRQSLQS